MSLPDIDPHLVSGYVINFIKRIPFENRVYINNDSTPREREMYRKLKTEMARRLDEGERDLVIRNLQIVKRRNAGAAGQTRDGR